MQVYQDYTYITHKRNILCLFFQFLCIFHIVFFSEKWSTQLVILCIVLDCWSDKIVVKDLIFYNWGSQVCRFKVSICIHSTYFFIQCVMQYFFTNMFTIAFHITQRFRSSYIFESSRTNKLHVGFQPIRQTLPLQILLWLTNMLESDPSLENPTNYTDCYCWK